MTIQQVAQELIELKSQAEEAERLYSAKRDQMYSALGSQAGSEFEYGDYKFVKTANSTVVSVNKQSVIEALQAENLPEEVLKRIIGAALVESERWGGLRILRRA